jgi:hypothetical protein
MATTDQFLLAYQAYQEVQAELRQNDPASTQTPTDSAAAEAEAIPSGSLLLGLAEDGLPVLLDLYDPEPGPLLVAGDGGCGKTAFLKSLARATNLDDPGDIQFGVLSPFPEEWRDHEALPGCLGVWPAYHASAHEFLKQLVSWADTLPDTRQVILLFVDGLDLLTTSSSELRGALRWLLSNGPERQVWPVVTVNPGRLARLQTWLEYFPTRILGRVKHAQTARLLSNGQELDLTALNPAAQFCLLRREGWLKFWLPPFNA